MGFFNKGTNGGFMDEIRCDIPDYLIWKWHPKGDTPGDNTRENAVRWGSSLRVRTGEVAVFVYGQQTEDNLDIIEGPFDKIIETENLPVLASVIGLAYAGGTPFQAEVYFINLAQIVQIQFGVPFFDVFDPRYLDFAVPTAVRGTLSFHIEDYINFIKLHRLIDFSLDKFKKQIQAALSRYIKDVVANAPAEHGIPVLQIERKIEDINELAESKASERLEKDFGVVVNGLDISAIEIDKASEGYRQLKAITQDMTTATVQAQTQVNIKNLEDAQRINAQNLEETLRIQRQEAQYAQHLETQASHFNVAKLDAQTSVGIAGANALGQMGANGGMDMSGGGGGMNPAAMMAGIAMGGAIGQNMASTMNDMMGNLQSSGSDPAPPPIPNAMYHVAIGNQPCGPYDIAGIRQLHASGSITSDTLVWKNGMADWVRADSVTELVPIFSQGENASTPPPIPTN